MLGSTLLVYPFAGLVGRVHDTCPRVLFNKEPVGPWKNHHHDHFCGPDGSSGACDGGAEKQAAFDPDVNFRDAAWIGDCDAGVRAFCRAIDRAAAAAAGPTAAAAAVGKRPSSSSWEEELDDLFARRPFAQFDGAYA